MASSEMGRGTYCQSAYLVEGVYGIVIPCQRAHHGIEQKDGSYRLYHYKKRWHPDALRTVPECQAYVDTVMAHPAWVGPVDIVVTAGRAARWATARQNPNRVNLPLWARMPGVVLHEMAHHATPDRYPSHGAEFCAEFLKLVLRHMGKESALALARAFREHRVAVAAGRLA